MMIKFLYIVNKQGLLRLSRYYQHYDDSARRTMESELIKICLTRNENECTFLEYEDFTVIFRRYVNLLFIAGVTSDENELAIMELFQHIVETLIKHFEKVSEMDILFNLDTVHMILDEMIVNGNIAETSQARILAPLQLLSGAKR